MNISKVPTEDLYQEIKRREAIKYAKENTLGSPIGEWKVTTEGDCEGRMVKDLGVFKGHIVDIALKLAKRHIMV